MKMFGLNLSEGSVAQNLTINRGTTLPSNPESGELFFLTAQPVGLHLYNGTAWVKIETHPSVSILSSGGRSFDTAFQVSSTLNATVHYVVSLSATNNQITIDLQTSTSSSGPWTTIASAANSSTFSGIGLGSITSVVDSTIAAFIPAGYYVKLTSSGSGSKTFKLGHEVIG